MTYKTKLALFISIFFWSSAFVGIRYGIKEYSPEGLALLRYVIASIFMGAIYFCFSKKSSIRFRDKCGLLFVGAIGIGVYNICLNYGEVLISSGMASFIISQSPVVTAILAILFLGERINFLRLIGFIISIIGVALIAIGETNNFKWDVSLYYILLATFAGSLYSVLQKPYLEKYRVIESTTYVIWGGTIFLLFYTPWTQVEYELLHSSLQSTLTVIYLGLFPAAFAYIAWSYVLAKIPASQAVSFLYFMPFLATLLGWAFLQEIPVWLSLFGGLLSIFGVWFVNQSSA